MSHPSLRSLRTGGNSQPRPVEGFCLCVGGVSGVGKTTLLRNHVESQEGRDFQRTGSSVVKEIIAPATVQELDAWPCQRREAVREEAIERLRTLRKWTVGRLLIDGHFTLRNRSTGLVESIFTPGDRGFYDALVLVEAPIVQVLEWRRRDNRDRGSETPEQVEQHIAAERAEGVRLAGVMGVPLLVITKTDSAERLRELRDFLDQCASLDEPQ